jgi:hypothetical protein
MGYLEKDTCVKRDFWTACSRMSIEDQLYGLAFASETDQDLCMKVTCARRWSEVEDALAESCTAADTQISPIKKLHNWSEANDNAVVIEVTSGNVAANKTITIKNNLGNVVMTYTTTAQQTVADWLQSATAAGAVGVAAQGYEVGFAQNANPASDGTINILVTGIYTTRVLPLFGGPLTVSGSVVTTSPHPKILMGDVDLSVPSSAPRRGGFVDLYINVRVTNGHPKALDTILRVRFTVAYTFHAPSAVWTWNTRASTAASGVINSGVVGDAPEGGKQQHEDTTVVA